MVRFAVAPPPPKGSRPDPFAAQLALARVHSRLVAVERVACGYEVEATVAQGLITLPEGRGLAGYGLARALRLLLDVLAGMAALHDTQTEGGVPFVHGELVPAALRVDACGVARLIPLAPWHSSAPGTLANEARWGHLAPERLLGDAIDQRADVFSAGVLLWEALAGRRLFESESVDSIIMRLMGGKVSLPQLPPELGWAVPLEAVAMRALSVDPEQRFANCAELAEAIEAVASEHVATHADIASFFGSRQHSVRPSGRDSRPSVATHNSSLSALVAPIPLSQPAPGQSSLVPGQRESAAPEVRASRRPWAVAALLSVLVAAGVSVAVRHYAGVAAVHSAAPGGAVMLNEPKPVPAPLPLAAALPTEPVTAPVAVTSAEPEAPHAPEVSPSSEVGGRVKPLKLLKTPRLGAPKLKAPANPAHTRDKEADQYGI